MNGDDSTPEDIPSETVEPGPWGYMPLDQITDDHGPYQSQLILQLPDGTILQDDEARDYMRRTLPQSDDS
jgi:hypothetical protein